MRIHRSTDLRSEGVERLRLGRAQIDDPGYVFRSRILADLVVVVASANLPPDLSFPIEIVVKELSVISNSIEFSTWVLQKLEKFPRSHRYGIGSRIETKLYELVDLLIEAKYSQRKRELLRQAGLRIEQLRFLLRICLEVRCLAYSSHQYAIETLSEIGQQIGGWRKHSSGD